MIIAETQSDLPVISIVMAVYNGEKFLTKCIESITSQSYSKIEYIVIDGGSKDATVDIIKSHAGGITYWVSEKDGGIYDAWNKAMKVATGEWICFIGADDFFANENVVQTIVTYLQKLDHNVIKFVYGKVSQVGFEDDQVIEVLGSPWHPSGFDKQMTLAHCTSFHHKSLFEENGLFNSSFKIAGDYEFLLREYKKNPQFAYFLDVPVAMMRTGGVSGSLKNRLIMAQETNRARNLNGFNSISLPIILWLIRINAYLLFEKFFGNRISNRLADYYRRLKGKRKRWSV
jgi:glycosyltransferase involved in cell wall biosynthesis